MTVTTLTISKMLSLQGMSTDITAAGLLRVLCLLTCGCFVLCAAPLVFCVMCRWLDDIWRLSCGGITLFALQGPPGANGTRGLRGNNSEYHLHVVLLLHRAYGNQQFKHTSSDLLYWW